MLGSHQPVAQHFEEAGRANFRGRVQIFGKRSNGAFVDLEEKTVLAAEVLEDGTLGDAERDGDIADAGGVITMLREMLRGGFDDSAAFRLRSGARGGLALVLRRGNPVAGNSWHRNDYKSRKHTAGVSRFQLHFYCYSR